MLIIMQKQAQNTMLSLPKTQYNNVNQSTQI